MKKRFLWITDPWKTLEHPKDTTLRLIEESVTLGFENFWCDVKTIRLENQAVSSRGSRVMIDACPVKGVAPGRTAEAFHLGPPEAMSPDEFGRILYRTDPPVDLAWLQPLQLLVLGTPRPGKTEIINPPQVLLSSGEKTEAALLGDLCPPCVVSSQLEYLEAFGHTEGRTLLKPLHDCQSHGIELLDWTSKLNAGKSRVALERATEGFRRPVLLQHFLKDIADGEQRLWFLNGKLLACARKKPKSGDFIINMDRGGTLEATSLTGDEKRAAARIGKLLRAKKIRLAAVDLIGGKVTDFNFTSPGLLVQIETLLGTNLARPIVKSLAQSFR